MIERSRRRLPAIDPETLVKLGAAVGLGLAFGVLVVIPPYLPLPSSFRPLVWVIPFAFLLVVLFKDLQKLILFAIAVSVPLNLDFSVIVSPFARNALNIAQGNRTIVALTELRVSLLLLVVVVGYVLWLVERQGPNHRPVRFFAATSLPALGLILISTLSILWAQDRQLAFFKVFQLVQLFLVYFYLANHLRTQKDLQFFLVVFMGAMLAESLLMIVQWRTGWTFSMPGVDANLFGKRAIGTLGQADVAAGIIASHLAIVAAMMWIFQKRWQKVIAGFCFLIGSAALISTFGRAAWGSFLVVIIGLIIVGWRRGWVNSEAVVWLLLLSVIIGAIFFPDIHERLTAYDHGSAVSRPKMFRLAWNLIVASPSHFFLGVGINNYALQAPRYYSSDVGYLGYVIDSSVHNAYLLAWTETGLIGCLSFVGFLASPLLRAWRHIKSLDRLESLMALGLGSALTAMCIQMLADPYIARPLMNFVWILVSLIACLDAIILPPSRNLVIRQA